MVCRAEVGLLSHNVIVQGSQYAGDSLDDLGADQYGSQIMVHRAGEDPTPVQFVPFFTSAQTASGDILFFV